MVVLRSDIITLLKKKVMPCECTAMVERLNAVEKTADRPPFGVTFSPFAMIALAREVNLPELFSPVVYLLLRTIIRGWNREEGVQMETLEKSDLIRLMAAQRNMFSRVHPLEKRIKRKDSDEFSSRPYFRVRGLELKRSDTCTERCPLDVESFLVRHWDERLDGIDHIRIFHGAKESARQELRCQSCSRQIQYFFRGRRDALWTSIACDFVDSIVNPPRYVLGLKRSLKVEWVGTNFVLFCLLSCRQINPTPGFIEKSIMSSVTFMQLTQTTQTTQTNTG
jgi:hypothetical protein